MPCLSWYWGRKFDLILTRVPQRLNRNIAESNKLFQPEFPGVRPLR